MQLKKGCLRSDRSLVNNSACIYFWNDLDLFVYRSGSIRRAEYQNRFSQQRVFHGHIPCTHVYDIICNITLGDQNENFQSQDKKKEIREKIPQISVRSLNGYFATSK